MTLSEKIKALATSSATDEDRLQVLIHLTAELAQKIEMSVSNEFRAAADIEANTPITAGVGMGQGEQR